MPILTVHPMASCCFQDDIQTLHPWGTMKDPKPSAPQLLLSILLPAIFNRNSLFSEGHASLCLCSSSSLTTFTKPKVFSLPLSSMASLTVFNSTSQFYKHPSIFIPLCHKKSSDELPWEMRERTDYLKMELSGEAA